MVSTRLRLKTPAGFSFWRTVYSHGWCTLPPFFVDKKWETLERVLRLADGTLVHCVLRDSKSGIEIQAQSRRALTPIRRREITTQLRECLKAE